MHLLILKNVKLHLDTSVLILSEATLIDFDDGQILKVCYML